MSKEKKEEKLRCSICNNEFQMLFPYTRWDDDKKKTEEGRLCLPCLSTQVAFNLFRWIDEDNIKRVKGRVWLGKVDRGEMQE